ncbi:methionyl-tRNA formyltransferase [Aeromonas hydrophila]|uniref:methionyl-tRNA formyltransferase n=1 Tax=Aeromonas hydrophila TaxID=644 RepID=UPI0015DC518F|nr:formyltransferase family protein [Aeromonas hydrophila]BBT05950.1 methionyl-tRNA formyltransferase [Aeromonas hydrophila]
MFDENSKVVKIFATGLKGYKTIDAILSLTSDVIVCLGKDPKVIDDFSEEIIRLCNSHNVSFSIYPENCNHTFGLAIAAGWQRMIYDIPDHALVVFHDSILPRYRGFNPLVSALINRDSQVGVTALKPANKYDEGDIFSQRIIDIEYPIKISDAIDKICDEYAYLTCEIYEKFFIGELDSIEQDHASATYSLWRDDDDYAINWNNDAEYICNFINCVGYPYKGASASMNSTIVRVVSASVLPDLNIVNRDVGKIVFMDNGKPVVVCGKGLLRIDELYTDDNCSLIGKIKFRTRFK